MLHRLTIGVCIAAVVALIGYLTVVWHSFGRGIVWGVIQAPAYGVIAAYSWHCRGNATASRIVLVVAVLLTPFTVALARLVDEPPGYAAIIWIFWALFPQLLLAVYGGYLGYACVEYARQRRQSPNSLQGKLFVAVFVGVAILLAASIAFSNLLFFVRD